MVGDLQNNPGRSLFVRLTGPTSGPGAAGKFTDSATGEHGDLLDIIRERTGISRFPDLLAEARAHLGRPQPVLPDANSPRSRKSPSGTPASAARLFAASLPLAGSLAEAYLRTRCRVVLKSETARAGGYSLPLNVRFCFRKQRASQVSFHYLINCGKQTWLLSIGAQ